MRTQLFRARLGAVPVILLAGWCIFFALLHAEPAGGQVPKNDSGQLVGWWELKTYTLWKGTTAEHPYGDKPQGLLIYDQAGRMSVQFMKPGRPKFASGDRWKGTADELKAAFEGYFSYYGRYDVNATDGVVIHHVEGSLLPNWIGVSQKRFYVLAEKQLTLTTPTVVVGDKEVKAVLLWAKRE